MINLLNIIYFLFVLGFIIRSIHYYRVRLPLKKRARELAKERIPVRRARGGETAGVRRLFGIPIPPDSEVFLTEGPAEVLTITVRGNNTTEIWIGGVQIQSVPEETEALVQGRDSVRCEYTVMADDVQRRAYPVTIDDKSIEDLFGEERVKGGQKNSTSWRFRDITRREHRALFGGYGVMAGVFLLPAFFSFIAGLDSLLSFYDLEAALPFLITGAVFSVLSTVLLLMHPGYKTGRGEVCLTRGVLEKVYPRNPFSRRYRISGRSGSIFMPRKARKQLPREGSRVDMEIFFRMTAGRVRGYVTGLESFSLDESLRYRLLKRPVKWCVFGMALLITGLISLAVISDQYHTISLKAAYSFKTRGPRVISSAEESLSIHTSGFVLFDNFRIYSTSPSGSDFVLFDPSEDKYKYLQEDLLGEIAEAREFWDSFIREISGMFRYADGSSVNFRDKSIHSFQSLPILCTRPDAFIEYIRSRDIRYIEQMNPRSLEVTVHNNSDCRYFLDSLVREVKYELYFSMAYYADRSRLVIPDEYEYPLFFQKTGYSFIRPVNNPNLDSNILFTGYFDELMDAALLRLGSERLLNGLYFVETPVGPGYPEGVEGIGFSEAFELEEFCVLLIIPMVYLVSALMLLVSALFRIFRDY